MRLSLALLWWMAGDESLSLPARAAIADDSNTAFVSAASAWEVATKSRPGKLPGAVSFIADLDRHLLQQGLAHLPITLHHGRVAGTLPGPHRDPFDRMLIAQALVEDLVLVANERPFDEYGVTRLW